jgi:serine/threonine protein phosphatase PrpC
MSYIIQQSPIIQPSHKVDLHIDEGYSRNSTKKKYNTEDRPFIFDINNEIYVLGVADGHGKSSFYSILCSGSFKLYFLKNYNDTNKNIEESLLKTFEDINFLANKFKVSKRTCGTTLNCCVIDKKNNKAYVANLGDSVTNIFRKIDNVYTSIYRSCDHGAESIIEQDRITKIYDNVVFKKVLCATYLYYDGVESMLTGSIGNFNYPSGLHRNIPDINCIDLMKGDIIIVSSDGYYEHYSTVNKILGPGRNENEISNDLMLLEENFKLSDINISKELFDLHIKQIAKTYIGNKKYNLEKIITDIKNVCDNNTIITFIV